MQAPVIEAGCELAGDRLRQRPGGVRDLRESGLTLQAIADRLNEEGIPTLRGGAKWRPSSVQSAAGYRRPPRRSKAVASGEVANGGPANRGGG